MARKRQELMGSFSGGDSGVSSGMNSSRGMRCVSVCCLRFLYLYCVCIMYKALLK